MAPQKDSDEPLQLLNFDGSERRNELPDLSADDLRSLYESMKRTRVLDERMMLLQRQGRIGFYGTARGQEASVTGSVFALEPQDWIFPALREAAAARIRGFPLRDLIAQLYGKATDLTHGRQMPCHYSYRDGYYVAMSSNVGTQLPHAVGAGLAAKLRKDNTVVIAYLGDGATSEGDFHVAMNFAGVFKTPTIFFCQNNQFAISVPVSQQTAVANLASKAFAYGFEGVRVDGNDVLAVYQVTKEAVEKARTGDGPTLIEAYTYRIGAHSSSDDPSRYRDEEETKVWAEERDPLLRFRLYLTRRKLWNEDLEKSLEEEMIATVRETVREVEDNPEPALHTLFEDVYSDLPWHLQEQAQELMNSASNHSPEANRRRTP